MVIILQPFSVLAQNVPEGITYQGLARDVSNAVLVNQNISIKVGIYAPAITGTLEWEETHTLTTNQLGLFAFIIGQGTSTGSGSLTGFTSINWGANPHFTKISMDVTGGSSFLDMDTIQYWSVPYALHSGIADSLSQPMRLSQLSDVDTIGVTTGYVLKWNGSIWVPAADNDSDTAVYALNAGHSATSDTATYSLNVLSTIDTVPFSFNSDSSSFASNAASSLNALNSDYCDTATYALNVVNPNLYWNLTGNSGTTPAINFIGTIDNTDFVFKTNSIERMRILANGKIGIGTATPTAGLHIVGNDGVVAEGTFGLGATPPSGAGTRMIWYPKKAAFRAGGVSGSDWNDVNIGNYSFASGYDNRASGAYSTSFGSSSIASGQYSIAACENSTASGISSIAMGSQAIASGPYSVALGRGIISSDSSSVAIGYHCTSTAKYAMAFGFQTRASGEYSTTFGYWASANNHRGSFVYADGTSSTPTLSTADNQFMVRASGGTIFYSNSGLTAGVSLPAGGGSWASVSDRNKKENFKKLENAILLDKLNSLEISTWNYKSQDASIRHIGPMAQDFYRLFGFGESDTTITTIDIDGVSLAAIQALTQKTNELKLKSEEIELLKAEIEKLENENSLLEKRVVKMEQKLNLNNTASLFYKNAGK